MARAVVYTDGACINQGTQNARAGFGVFWGDGHANNCYGRVDGVQDSNRGELRAAHQAIKTATQKGFNAIEIRTDSTYVVDTVPRASGFQSALQNRDIMQGIHEFSKKISIQVVYIPGHSGNYGNEQANMLAKAGAKL